MNFAVLRIVAVSAVASVFLSGPSVQASTLTQVVAPLTRPIAPMPLDDLLRQDALGYDCIDENQIDVAFFAAGKGMRLPQTCLPEPCKAALSTVQLASVIGRPPSPAEWDEYYSRYAEICRKETIAFRSEDAAKDNLERTPPLFWAPILGGKNVVTEAGPPTPIGPIVVGGGGGSSTGGGGGGTTGGGGGSSTGGGGGGGQTGGGGGDGGTDTPPVPLPMAFWMLVSGVLSLAGVKLTRGRATL